MAATLGSGERWTEAYIDAIRRNKYPEDRPHESPDPCGCCNCMKAQKEKKSENERTQTWQGEGSSTYSEEQLLGVQRAIIGGPDCGPWEESAVKQDRQRRQRHLAGRINVLAKTVLMCFFLLVAAIGNAFAVLSNPDKRLRYDEYGDEQATVTAPRARPYNYYRDFEADITPEELFNVFFGGHFPTGNIHMFSNVTDDTRYYRRRHRHERTQTRKEEEEDKPQTTYSAFIQLLPVLVIVIISVITQLLAANPPYSLFYKSSESELTNLAGLYRDERLKQKAESLKLENCEKLNKLTGLRRGG
ncbi:dnaJ homolog subfamily C member 18 [Otolemur garnettii]|uniref:dnaJ homolog subfamily C member 18 n=1 Tax=Otolemur garnettii TaxID=30611 RepID=UPI000643F4BC|nr:dnaJ homolog subfamily C member 18 [Otolemur garnettii]